VPLPKVKELEMRDNPVALISTFAGRCRRAIA